MTMALSANAREILRVLQFTGKPQTSADMMRLGNFMEQLEVNAALAGMWKHPECPLIRKPDGARFKYSLREGVNVQELLCSAPWPADESPEAAPATLNASKAIALGRPRIVDVAVPAKPAGLSVADAAVIALDHNSRAGRAEPKADPGPARPTPPKVTDHLAAMLADLQAQRDALWDEKEALAERTTQLTANIDKLAARIEVLREWQAEQPA